mmetsp:Transcript_21512/g.21845  ORF Transcript_21512/g.21845 Transcript_21512/m.21845 type:complete len:105 (-) Transcript_21512:239-553(-)
MHHRPIFIIPHLYNATTSVYIQWLWLVLGVYRCDGVGNSFGLATGVLFSLSPQAFVSCAPNPNRCGGTGGCLGSMIELALRMRPHMVRLKNGRMESCRKWNVVS